MNWTASGETTYGPARYKLQRIDNAMDIGAQPTHPFIHFCDSDLNLMVSRAKQAKY